ncbi:beta-3 adrenergic receptor-like [Amphiura filiformis]|uniref:beta-3 adrenergic receptor-like n=1 Tax=Amphiura filiformis TaxID=82378 RepID=UPI003B21E343
MSKPAFFNDSLTLDLEIHNPSSAYSYGERIFVGLTWLLISVLGTTGNSLVIISILLSHKLQTSTNIFVASLATADLLTCLFLIWNVLALLGHDGWPLPQAEWLCAVTGFMVYFCTGTSIYTLATIALNRFVLITKSLKTYQKIFLTINIRLMVMFTWCVPFGTFLSIMLAGVGVYGYDTESSTCTGRNKHPGGSFHIMTSVFVYPIPLITIITSYILVFMYIKRHFKKKRMNELHTIASTASTSQVMPEKSRQQIPATEASTSAEGSGIHQSTRRHADGISQREIGITKNLFLVVVAFFICYSPCAIALVIPRGSDFLLYGVTLVFANSAINPVIYARRHPHFKIVFTALIKCQYDKIPEPTDFLKRFLIRRVHPFP